MTRPAYDPAATYQFKTTAFPFTEAESVPATMTEAAVAAAGIATEEMLLLVKAQTDLIPADPATVTKQDEIIEDIAAILTTQLTESYAADGVAPTAAQMLFLIQQSLHEFAISGTTRTVKKLDGTTTAATFTLDSETAPTSTTRAS